MTNIRGYLTGIRQLNYTSSYIRGKQILYIDGPIALTVLEQYEYICIIWTTNSYQTIFLYARCSFYLKKTAAYSYSIEYRFIKTRRKTLAMEPYF